MSRIAAVAAGALLLASVAAARDGGGPLDSLPAYRVTEYSPVIKGRQDIAFQRALEAAFRKAVVAALREGSLQAGAGEDFTAWQSSFFSRAADFIASYKILSQSQDEGHLSLTVEARVDRGRIEKALEESSGIAPLLPVRLLVMVDNFPIAGTAGGDDIDAGHAAALALESALLKQGAIILPAPEPLPWQGLERQASAENRLALATGAARRQGAEYLVLGVLESRSAGLLALSAELFSLSSEKRLAERQAVVEIRAGVPPRESFTDAADEMSLYFSRKLAGRADPPSTPVDPQGALP